MTKLFLITGIPGSGKTTLTNQLASNVKSSQIVSFGKLISEMKKETPYNKLRSDAFTEVPISLVFRARQMLLQRLSRFSEDETTFLDAHSVINYPRGLRVIPGLSPEILSYLTCLVFLDISFKVNQERIKLDPQGRTSLSYSQFHTLRHLQLSTAISYSVSTGKPLFCVDANHTPQHVLESVLEIYYNVIK